MRGIVVAKERFVCCQMSGIRKELMKREKTEMGKKKKNGRVRRRL